MRILFDHNVPRRLRRHLPIHEITTTKEMGWTTLANGALLKAAADAGFEACISLDKKIEHEHNLKAVPLPVVIIDAPSNALPSLLPFAPFILDLLNSPLDRLLYVVDSTGTVHRLMAPRKS